MDVPTPAVAPEAGGPLAGNRVTFGMPAPGMVVTQTRHPRRMPPLSEKTESQRGEPLPVVTEKAGWVPWPVPWPFSPHVIRDCGGQCLGYPGPLLLIHTRVLPLLAVSRA